MCHVFWSVKTQIAQIPNSICQWFLLTLISILENIYGLQPYNELRENINIVLQDQQSYSSSSAHGVTSKAHGPWSVSFMSRSQSSPDFPPRLRSLCRCCGIFSGEVRPRRSVSTTADDSLHLRDLTSDLENLISGGGRFVP